MNKIGCPICKHFQFDGTCTAFEQGIPFGFLAGIAVRASVRTYNSS
jgi:hypothetical protein